MSSGRSSSSASDSFTGFLRKNAFIISACVVAAIVFSATFAPESIATDSTSLMILGKQLLQGTYDSPLTHRSPLVPAIFSVLYAGGLSVVAIRFVVPLAFIILSLISTYLLARQLGGERIGMLSVAALFCFPQFWRWGTKLLADMPLLVFSTFALHYFLRGLDDRRYFKHMGVAVTLGLLVRLSFVIVLGILVLYLLLFRRKTLLSRGMIPAFIIPCLICGIIFIGASAARDVNDLLIVTDTLDSVSGQGKLTGLMQVMTGQYGDVTHFAKLALYPLILLAPLGMWLRRKKAMLHLFVFWLFFAFIFAFRVVRLRYFSPLYPLLAIFIAYGFVLSRERLASGMHRKIFTLIFVALAVVSFINTIYLLSLDYGMYSGVVTLAEYTTGLDGLIFARYMPDYLNLTNDVVEDWDWLKSASSGDDIYDGPEGARPDYVVLSVYYEFMRKPTEQTYHPSFGPFEITFVSRPYTGERVPPDYEFGSDLYMSLEGDGRFENVYEISMDGQRIFIIYEVM